MTIEPATLTRSATSPPPKRARRRPTLWPVQRRWVFAAVVVVWIAGWALLKDHSTLAVGMSDVNGLHKWLNDIRDHIQVNRNSSFFLREVIGRLASGADNAVGWLQDLLSRPSGGRPVPQIGWLGVTAIATWVGLAVAGIRYAVMVAVSMVLFGMLGYWSDSIDTLIITLLSVAVCVVIGVPIAVWMASSKPASNVITPLLDLLQTLPSFAYLAPLALVFGIGPAASVITTVIYAMPPLIRIAAHGIRGVDTTTMEAVRSLGSTGWQALRKARIPMARRTIVVGLNQCTLAALSMATITTLINGPGLGEPVLRALATLDIGKAFVSGLAIVIMAIMLDRTTSAASARADLAARGGPSPRKRLFDRGLLAVMAVIGLVLVYVSHNYLWAAQFPSSPDLGGPLADGVNNVTDAVVDSISGATNDFKDTITYGLINPLQSVLADSPWWLSGAALLLLAFLAGGWRPALIAIVCEAVILGTGLWNMTMVTLTSAVVATLMVLVVAVLIGVWMGRNRIADAIIRPVLDALQTLPAFVYLVPALALFAPSRFTAIIAAFLYAVPIAIKLVADGIRGVSPASVEAAESLGVTTEQMIRKVQLPMARAAVVLASNQGLLYVLSMVVVGGMVGGGGLGYLVVSGFSQGALFGKGLAAGVAITAIGVMLDRTAQHAAARQAHG